jgi:hypothetical protein
MINLLIGKTPVRLINLPNRSYWLAEERRQDTINTLKRYSYIMGSLTIGFLLFIFNYVFYKNINPGNKTDISFILSIVIYLVGMGFAVIKMVLRFYKKES